MNLRLPSQHLEQCTSSHMKFSLTPASEILLARAQVLKFGMNAFSSFTSVYTGGKRQSDCPVSHNGDPGTTFRLPSHGERTQTMANRPSSQASPPLSPLSWKLMEDRCPGHLFSSGHKYLALPWQPGFWSAAFVDRGLSPEAGCVFMAQ